VAAPGSLHTSLMSGDRKASDWVKPTSGKKVMFLL
jgi:hypothetical protein